MGIKTKAAVALGIAAALTVAVAAPAQADPWDGNDFVYGPGQWELSTYSNGFVTDDVFLVYPDTTTEYTDIWDGMGYTGISSASLGLVNEGVGCDPYTNVDITTDAGTGDLVISCDSTNPAWATAGLTVHSEIRIYSGGDLIRTSHTITNTTGAEVAIDDVEFYTDFGSSGDLWNYQGQEDAILPVPAAEDSTSQAAIAAAGAQWAIHFNANDAPGGIAWGSAGAAAPAAITTISGDSYYANVSAFTIPAGASRTVAYFANWNPLTLIDLGYTNSADSGQVEAADALIPAMAEFDSFSGRLTTGLTDVVNWGPVTAAAPALAATGVDQSNSLLLAGSSAGLLLLGAGALLVTARRRGTTTTR